MKKKAIGFQLPAAGWFWLDAFGFISRNSIPIIGRLWRPPPIRLRRTPPYAGGRIGCSTLLLVSCSVKLSTHSPTSEAGGKVVGPATKGGPPPSGGIKNGAARRRTSPAERYYITPWAEPSTRPEGGANPGRNPWRPGPKARRRHQPSRRSRVNLREYGKHRFILKSPSPQISHTAKKHQSSD